MESVYLLVPLSVILVLAIGAVLAWAVMSGQFEKLDEEGDRVLREDPSALKTEAEDKKDDLAQ
jgi:cbb3-type cytochrome oxidase maturation protein